MCDTLSIVADWSENDTAYFAKNSDRSPNEPHLVLRVPGTEHASGAMVKCTYISIPQVEYTREMILCKPSWIWGAEMGVKESRVAIGNAGGFIGDHTTGSLVAVLRKNKPITMWSTGSSTPCISAFKPVFWNSASAPLFETPESGLNYWLKREHVHRAVIAGKADAAKLRDRLRDLESDWLLRESKIIGENSPDTAELAELSRIANEQEQAVIDEFYVKDWRDIRSRNRYTRYWDKKNEHLSKTRKV